MQGGTVKTDGELLKAIEDALAKPSEYSSHMPDVAILRIWSAYNFMEVGREEIKKAINGLRMAMSLGDVAPHDILLIRILTAMSGIDLKKGGNS